MFLSRLPVVGLLRPLLDASYQLTELHVYKRQLCIRLDHLLWVKNPFQPRCQEIGSMICAHAYTEFCAPECVTYHQNASMREKMKAVRQPLGLYANREQVQRCENRNFPMRKS